MYSFYEIRIIFARCNSIAEVLTASDAFEAVIDEGLLNEEQKRFTTKEEIIRTRQIRSIKRKK